jgi:hypothetical protein
MGTEISKACISPRIQPKQKITKWHINSLAKEFEAQYDVLETDLTDSCNGLN